MRKTFLLLLLFSGGLFAQPKVLVSIAPQKYLVEQIAEDRVRVEVIVPEGASPHTYEPTPRQAIGLTKGEVWFRIGESFEHRLIKLLESKVEIIDQREGLELLADRCCCCKEAVDPHIWLSPVMLKKEAEQIAHVLSRRYPESAPFFQKNCVRLCQRIDLLHQEISDLLKGKEGEAILVSHPAFGYFCKEYGLKQIAIEADGKEPSTKRILELLEEARNASVSSVYLQKQYSMKGGEKIAKHLQAKVVMVNPYEEDVLTNLKMFAETL